MPTPSLRSLHTTENAHERKHTRENTRAQHQGGQQALKRARTFTQFRRLCEIDVGPVGDAVARAERHIREGGHSSFRVRLRWFDEEFA